MNEGSAPPHHGDHHAAPHPLPLVRQPGRTGRRLLAGGGQESQCGWLKDRFGFSWQIVPSAIPRLLGQAGPDKAKKVWEKLMTMKKIDIAALEAAAR